MADEYSKVRGTGQIPIYQSGTLKGYAKPVLERIKDQAYKERMAGYARKQRESEAKQPAAAKPADTSKQSDEDNTRRRKYLDSQIDKNS